MGEKAWLPIGLPITVYLCPDSLDWQKLGTHALYTTGAQSVVCWGGGATVETEFTSRPSVDVKFTAFAVTRQTADGGARESCSLFKMSPVGDDALGLGLLETAHIVPEAEAEAEAEAARIAVEAEVARIAAESKQLEAARVAAEAEAEAARIAVEAEAARVAAESEQLEAARVVAEAEAARIAAANVEVAPNCPLEWEPSVRALKAMGFSSSVACEAVMNAGGDADAALEAALASGPPQYPSIPPPPPPPPPPNDPVCAPIGFANSGLTESCMEDIAAAQQAQHGLLFADAMPTPPTELPAAAIVAQVQPPPPAPPTAPPPAAPAAFTNPIPPEWEPSVHALKAMGFSSSVACEAVMNAGGDADAALEAALAYVQPPPPPPLEEDQAPCAMEDGWDYLLHELAEMGFNDADGNMRALAANHGEMTDVVAALVAEERKNRQ